MQVLQSSDRQVMVLPRELSPTTMAGAGLSLSHKGPQCLWLV